ncbi:MAG: nucleoside recognition domain-containing protein [Eubacteriales bacterium]|nr:nucleoside recognition domain-containing protein [Eubacteriales bacterium]
MMNYLWVGLIVLACITACLTGRTAELSAAVTDGAGQAVTLCLSLAGLMGLWTGILELMQQSGLCEKITFLLRPILSPLFRRAAEDKQAIEHIAANVTANLLGLSNAATPIGLQAADRLYSLYQRKGTPDEVLTFVILNTTSIQLIPTTVAAVRASLGAPQPFDIMPAVWGASICSVAVGLTAAKLFAVLCRGRRHP